MSYLALTYDEQDVLRQVAGGDEKAFRVLFNKHHHKLGEHIFRLTKSQELTEEIVQDVFLKIWTNREVLSTIHHFEAYLYVVSKNHALNCLKKAINEKSRTTPLDDLICELQYEDSAEENEHYSLIDEAIDRLPSRQRHVYLLSRHERLQYAEIALKLNLSRETVKKYLKISSESITCYIRKRLCISLIIFLSYFI